MGDLTGDGRADILGRSPDASLRLYPGTGTGKVKPPSTIAGDWSGVQFVS